MSASAIALPPESPDPFLQAVREMHRLAELAEQVGVERVLEALPAAKDTWALSARRAQLPPQDADWWCWVLLAGRGFGKTRSISAAAHIAVMAGLRRLHIICPTSADVRDVLIEGPAGLLATAPPGWRPTWYETKRRVVWPNGGQALTFSGEEPDSLRGPEAEMVLIDELARMTKAQQVYDTALAGLRIGAVPRMLIATTPKSETPLIKKLVRVKGVAVTNGSTYDNVKYLAPSFLENITSQWAGTRKASQELYGLLLENEEQELFREAWIKVAEVPSTEIERVAVGVDPSGGVDLVGIVACARLVDGGYAVLADRSCKGSPAHWSEQAIRLADELEAEDLVVETNFGGAMATDTIKQTAIRMAEQGKRAEPFIRIKEVVAHRGKAVRAEPISALYEQGKVVHRPGLEKLEAEMYNFRVSWDRDHDDSPNRVDALVWAMTRLKALIVDLPMA